VAARFESLKDDPKHLFLNFTSFVWRLQNPVDIGNKYMTMFLKEQKRGAGVICVDAMTEELASHIISMNV
jgi:hypothetical protein